MSAKDILVKAVESDRQGRILQAQHYYEEGIQLLMNAVNGKCFESNDYRFTYQIL